MGNHPSQLKTVQEQLHLDPTATTIPTTPVVVATVQPVQPTISTNSQDVATWYGFRRQLKELWDTADKDGNGKLDASEVKELVFAGVQSIGKGVVHDAKTAAEITDKFMTDLAKQGKVEYEEFEQNANKYFLLLRDTNPIALVTDSVKSLERKVIQGLKDAEENVQTAIKTAAIHAAKEAAGSIIPPLINTAKEAISKDEHVMAALQCAERDYKWMEEKFKEIEQNVIPKLNKIGAMQKSFEDNKTLIFGVAFLLLLLPYLAIIKYLFLNVQ